MNVGAQLSFSDAVLSNQARARRDVGMENTAAHAERCTPGWCEQACEELRKLARRQAGVFTIELLRLRLTKCLPPPPDLRAWGVVTVMAQKRGFIQRVPGQSFAAASSNGSPKSVYRAGPQA